MNKLKRLNVNTESIEERESLISIRVQMLGAVYNRKVTDEMISVFKRVLNRFFIGTLAKAFSEAESDLERFPTPKMMRALCAEYSPSQAVLDEVRGCPACDFTGWKLVPHPEKGVWCVPCSCRKICL